MNTADKLRQHPLFTNRYRVLAVPSGSSNRRIGGWFRSKLILQNLLVAGLILTFFAAGAALTDPAFLPALRNLVGQGWSDLLSAILGVDLGSGLAESSPWVSARVGGIVAYLMLFASTALGLANKLRLFDRVIHRAGIMYLHRFVSLAAFLFTGLHVGGLLLDVYLKINLLEVVLPFSANYRPLWTGLGTIALYSTLAVALTAYFAQRLGYKVWRVVHYLSFAVFVASFIHGFMAGSDSKSDWMQLIYLITGATIAFLTGVRFFNRTASGAA